jgi:hypothetical protein
MKNMDLEKTVLNEAISRNDLIDYAISKRVEDIKIRKTEAKRIYDEFADSSNNKIKELNKNIKKIHKNEMDAYIQSNYSETIKLMEANLKSKAEFITSDSKERTQQEIRYMLRLKEGDVLIAFLKEKVTNRMYGRMHPMEIFDSLESFIRISADSIKSEEIDSIENEKKLIKEELESLRKNVSDCDNEITKIKSQKDIIKNSLIEQSLSTSEEGKRMLDILNNLDLSGTKLLG